jgi:hypothetical protein
MNMHSTTEETVGNNVFYPSVLRLYNEGWRGPIERTKILVTYLKETSQE